MQPPFLKAGYQWLYGTILCTVGVLSSILYPIPAHPQPTSLSIEIIEYNCPVYSEPKRADQFIIYTVQLGEIFEVLETVRTEYPEPFYRIKYGTSNETGWVYGKLIKVRELEDINARIVQGIKKPPDKTLYDQIQGLIEIYNTESAQLTSAYNLRPVPSYSFPSTLQSTSLIQPRNGILTVPLIYAGENRKLHLPNAERLLFQLIFNACFKQTIGRPEQVVVKIHFKNGGIPIQMVYKYREWLNHGNSGLDDFWEAVGCDDKDQLWNRH